MKLETKNIQLLIQMKNGTSNLCVEINLLVLAHCLLLMFAGLTTWTHLDELEDA